jgi:predicted neutral ceramidase superfamily lipid hydrolase
LKTRLTWFILVIITIILGLLSRHIAGIPLFIGDILWATMIYFGFRFLFIYKSVKFIIIASLLFCYAIEFSQLYQAPWINNIRHTVIGGLVLGEAFLWGDLLSYTIGVAIGVIIERGFIIITTQQRNPKNH